MPPLKKLQTRLFFFHELSFIFVICSVCDHDLICGIAIVLSVLLFFSLSIYYPFIITVLRGFSVKSNCSEQHLVGWQ